MEHEVSLEEWERLHKDPAAYARTEGGFKLDDPLLDTGTGWLYDMGEVRRALMAIDQYNLFDPESVANLLEANWYRIRSAKVGYEHSPAVYVQMKDEAPAAFLHTIYHEMWADETFYIGESRSLIRFWWD